MHGAYGDMMIHAPVRNQRLDLAGSLQTAKYVTGGQVLPCTPRRGTRRLAGCGPWLARRNTRGAHEHVDTNLSYLIFFCISIFFC